MNALKDLLETVPETVAALNEVMQENPKMKVAGIQSSLKATIQKDELAVVTQEALNMSKRVGSLENNLAKARRDSLLRARLIMWMRAPLQANPEAWEAELEPIWNEWMQQADTADGGRKVEL